MPIPHDNPAGFWRVASATQFYDIVVALAAFAVGSVGTFKLYVDEWYGAALAAAAGSVVVCAASVVRAVLTYKREAKKQSLHELYGCLVTLHALLIGDDLEAGTKAKPRLTVHVSIDDRLLKQVLDYVGNPRGGQTAHRKFPIQSGIAGRVYRTGNAYHAKRVNDEYEAYIDELVTNWNYVEKDARALSPATMSWMAVPLQSSSKIEGSCTRTPAIEISSRKADNPCSSTEPWGLRASSRNATLTRRADMADKPITTESSKEHEEITRVTVSNVGAAIYVEEITVPRALREAMERQFERASQTVGAARGHFEESVDDPNDFNF